MSDAGRRTADLAAIPNTGLRVVGVDDGASKIGGVEIHAKRTCDAYFQARHQYTHSLSGERHTPRWGKTGMQALHMSSTGGWRTTRLRCIVFERPCRCANGVQVTSLVMDRLIAL